MAKVEGRENLALPRDEVWRRLNDPDLLAHAIPGCSGFEAVGQDKFQTRITVAVGPVRGVYAGTVRYQDVEAPERCTIAVNGRGDKGTIQGEGAITLGESGVGTEVFYTGSFRLTGPVAGVGQRLAPGISRRMIVETLRNLECAPAQASAGSSDHTRADTEGATQSSVSNGTHIAGGDPNTSTSPVRGNHQSVDFRPLAVPSWAMFALGFVSGVAITIILEAL